MSIWAQAKARSAHTPAARNRSVDFLRALAILVVISGHWLIATAWYVDGKLLTGHLLRSDPWTQWLTWQFQVMPLFFIVGGYANGVSSANAMRRGVAYGGWLRARLNRLVAPLLLLVIAWALLSLVMALLGAGAVAVHFASRAALIPTWFLAIYIMVVVLVPLSHRLWCRYRFWSFGLFAVAAVLVDWAFFVAGLEWLGWSNYFFVWLAVHQLGYAWHDRAGSNRSPGRVAVAVAWAVTGYSALWLLVHLGPYPLAMVGSPDQHLSNTSPPKVTLICLAIGQFGLLLALERPMARLLQRGRWWAATVLVNSMIMTLYLWHITLMIVVVGLLYLAGGFALGLEPGTAVWWLSRIPWLASLGLLLVPVALWLSPLERRAAGVDAGAPAGAWRQVAGAALLCLGVALLALYGYGGSHVFRLDVAALALVVVGAGISGLLPRWQRRKG